MPKNLTREITIELNDKTTDYYAPEDRKLHFHVEDGFLYITSSDKNFIGGILTVEAIYKDWKSVRYVE